MQDVTLMRDVLKCLTFALEQEASDNESAELSEVDARWFIEICHKMSQEANVLLEGKGDDEKAAQKAQIAFFGVLMSKNTYRVAERIALAAADGTLEEAKSIIKALKHTCATPWQKDQKAWADFNFETDFASALGVLSSVSGRDLMHQQVQFVSQFVTFLKSACVLAEAKSAKPSRRERKIAPEWCTMINDVRSSLADLQDFAKNPRVQAGLFKDPEVLTVDTMFGQNSSGPSLQIKFDMAPLQDTMKNG